MDLPSFGVEEEFLLVDCRTGHPAARNAEVARLAARRGVDLQLELSTCQIEAATPKSESSSQLGQEVSRLRIGAAQAAREVGATVLAVGVPPMVRRPAPVTATPRYRRIAHHFGMVAYEQCICACHVHVEVPSRASALEAGNWLRPWLPLLLALTANSPIHRNADTGYASWRSVLWGRWPSAGPPPHWASVAQYDAAVSMLIDSGAMLDEGMVYWDVRPSSRYPTVEIRVADVPATAAETVLFATLCRAAVMTALSDLERGVPARRVDDPTLRAAYWKAAHDGMESAPAAWALAEFLTLLAPALEELGDEWACSAARQLLRRGNGAVRQRRVWREHGSVSEVVAHAAAATIS